MHSKEEVFILGIDPGSISAGYALVKCVRRDFEIVKSGACKLNQKDDFFNRISTLSNYFKKLVKNLPPYELSLETLIHVKNVNSLAKLAQARGAIISAVFKGMVSICEYSPNLIKSTVSGYGLSSKQNLEKSLSFVFPNYKPQTHDESDAVAIALCHSLRRGTIGRIGQSRNRKTRGMGLKESFKHLK